MGNTVTGDHQTHARTHHAVRDGHDDSHPFGSPRYGLGASLPRVYLPSELEDALGDFQTWFEELASSRRVGDAPNTFDSRTMTAFCRTLWQTAGMDSTLGLARATPNQRRFREVVGEYFYRSEHLRRCFEKPAGYLTDTHNLEGIYQGDTQTRDVLGRWIDRWFFADFPVFAAARNRCAITAELLKVAQRNDAQRVMSVGCASARELELAHPEFFERILLLDADAAALEYSAELLREATVPAPTIQPVRARGHQLWFEDTDVAPGTIDLAYSLNRFEDLDDRLARELAERVWRTVRPGGAMVIGNLNGHHWGRYVLEAVMDCFLVYRDPDELEGLTERLPRVSDRQVLTDTTGIAHLLVVRKGI
ncbi:MAG: class I SAM-dependent methyltransferase [Pseudomonadota bacterium]